MKAAVRLAKALKAQSRAGKSEEMFEIVSLTGMLPYKPLTRSFYKGILHDMTVVYGTRGIKVEISLFPSNEFWCFIVLKPVFKPIDRNLQ